MKYYQARSSDNRRKAFDSESTGFRDAPFEKTSTAEGLLHGSPTLGYGSLLNNERMYFVLSDTVQSQPGKFDI